MKKITKTEFIKIIDPKKYDIPLDKRIDPENINETKIGKNFVYDINSCYKLKNVQKRIEKYFLKKINVNNASVAYRNNYSYYNLLEPHKKNYNFLRLDIKSFFYSINSNDIKECFKNYFEDSSIETQSLIDIFINLTTYKIPQGSINSKYIDKDVLPIGFITSPSISNILFRKLDIQIQKFCSQKNIEYTRYADDMLFSSNKDLNYIHSDSFKKEIKIILSQMKFKLNTNKTMKRKHTISLNGYTIQYSEYKVIAGVLTEKKINEIRLSNKKTYIINRLITMILKQKINETLVLKKLFNITTINKGYDIDQLLNKSTGYRSYLISIIKFNDKYKSTNIDTINKYIKMVKNLEKVINMLVDKRKGFK